MITLPSTYTTGNAQSCSALTLAYSSLYRSRDSTNVGAIVILLLHKICGRFVQVSQVQLFLSRATPQLIIVRRCSLDTCHNY